jgi:hypothetical protein
LYYKDAQGLVDEELIDEVGTALYARCESILLVSSASIKCPRCRQVFQVGRGHSEEDIHSCPVEGCDWQTTHRQYHNSWRHQDLIGTRAESAFRAYVEQYPHARDPGQKMILIDQLIHAFHQGIRKGVPHRAAANNLIEGRHREVVAFLDRLAYGDGSTPGIQEVKEEWQVKMRQAERARRSG